MEFNRLAKLNNISLWWTKFIKVLNNNGNIQRKTTKVISIKIIITWLKTLNEIDNWIKEAEEVGEVAVIDTETSSLDPHQAELIGSFFKF